jgi:hypothetical protein
LALALLAMPALNVANVQAEDDDETELAKHMSKISSSFKKLRRALKDPEKNKSSVALVDVCIASSKACIELMPEVAGDLKGTKKAAMIEGYKKMMGMLIAEFGNMKKALEANKNGDAQTSYAKLLKLKSKGHEAFTE